MIATFDDEDIFDELVLFLKSKNNVKKLNTFPTKNYLEYDSLVIDLKCRTVEVEGKNIELTNYEFEILYLLARNPGQVFSKEQIYNQVWNAPYYGNCRNDDCIMDLLWGRG